MDKFEIQGGVPLEGEIAISGAKNSALPALAACLLTAEPVVLDRIPPVRDIHTMEKLLEHAGARVTVEGERVTVEAGAIENAEAPYDLVKTMRASSLVLGPLVARCGRARVSVPGGCAIGARPINLHVAGLEQLGATIRQEHGYIEAEAPHGLEGAEVHFDRITVTGTEDLLMAAVLARGETVIHNAAREPEVVDLAALLTKMGAHIEGAGTSVIRVKGVAKLHGAQHTIIADRIETGTFLIAGAMTRGDLLVTGCEPDHLRAFIAKLVSAGAEVSEPAPGTLRVRAARKTQERGRHHRGTPRLRHRSAGPVHGADDAGRGDFDHHRNHFRKPLHACAGAGAHGRQHPAGGPPGNGRRTHAVIRRAGDRQRSARQRLAGAGRTGRAGGDRDRPGLPHRPRL